jgi:glutamate carboxypeptidase
MSKRMLRAAYIFLIATVIPGAVTAQLQDTEARMAQWVEDHRGEAAALLETIVNINSHTLNPEGVREVAHVLAPEFEALGFDVRWIDGAPFDRAGHLFAERRGDGATKVLVISHLDTVYPADSPFQSFERIDETTVKGPGVSDDKGGVVTMLFALKALQAEGLLDGMNLTLAIIGDEERGGSPRELSRGDLIRAAEWADVALGFEDGDGNPATAAVARRGGTGWTLTTTGVRGHSSLIFGTDLGFGAVFEAARILNVFREQLVGEQYLTFNPGLVLGGSEIEHEPSTSSGSARGVSNIVSEKVVVTGDLRVISGEQGTGVMDRMRDIVAQSLPGTSATIEFRGVPQGMSPTPGNYRLHALYDQLSQDLGTGSVTVIDPSALGGADITGAAPYVSGALAGIGMAGTNAHSFEEIADLDGMAVLTKRAAVLFYRLAQEPFVLVP